MVETRLNADSDPSESAHGTRASLRNSVLYLVGALMQGLGLFAVQPFALRVLNNDVKWQELYLSVSLIQVGVVLAAAGLPLAITKVWFDPNGQAKARSISGFLSVFGLLLGGIAAVLYWLLFSSQPGAASIAVGLGAMGVMASVLGAQAILRAQGRPGLFILLSLGSSVAAYAVGLVAMLVFTPSPTVFMTGYGITLVATAVAAIFITRPSSPFAVRGAAREALAIGLPVLPHTGALMLLTQGAVFLLAVTAPPGISGDYGKVQIFAMGTITLLGALNNAWVPALMAVRGKDRAARTRSIMTTASLASLGIVILASGGANVVTHIMTHGREDLVAVAQVLPLLALGYALYLIASTLLFADKLTWVLAVVTPAVLVAGFGMAWWPATAGSLVGTALASVLAFTLLGVVYWLITRGRAKGGWPVGIFSACAVASVAYVVVLMLLPPTLIVGWLTVLVVAALGCVGMVLWIWRQRRVRRLE